MGDSGAVEQSLICRSKALPPVSGVTTMFYYDDLSAVVPWYESVLGFEKLADYGWCALFRLAPRAYLALVDGSVGSQRPIDDANKGAILSIETSDLERWHARLSDIGVPGTETGLQPGCDARTLEFKVYDPSGYTIEFFRWVERPAAWPEY